MLKFFIFATSIAAALAVECGEQEDGIYDISCKSYAVCAGGEVTIHYCDIGKLFDYETMTCQDASEVGPPCDLYRDCSDLPNGNYPDLEFDCKSYYTCSNGVYFYHQYCPEGLVFEKTMGLCVWERDAYPPCGSRPIG